jgi:hypothetical protein
MQSSNNIRRGDGGRWRALKLTPIMEDFAELKLGSTIKKVRDDFDVNHPSRAPPLLSDQNSIFKDPDIARQLN